MISYIGLGSNLEQPLKQLSAAISHLKVHPGLFLLAVSSVYLTAPVGVLDQPDFYNQVVSVESDLSAHDFLSILQTIEQEMGRVREKHWGPRVIDCDLLLHGDERIDTKELIVPHPQMTARAFVLYPLAEISPGLVLPSGQNVLNLCEAVADQSITKLERESI